MTASPPVDIKHGPSEPMGMHEEPMSWLVERDSILRKIGYEPLPEVEESVLVYDGSLSDPELQRKLFDKIMTHDMGVPLVFSGIEGFNLLYYRKLVGEGSEAERDLSAETFYATHPDYWGELIETGQRTDNPFDYANRGWGKPIIAAFLQDKLYDPSVISALGVHNDPMSAVNDGRYQAFIDSNDPNGELRKRTTQWALREGSGPQLALHRVYYLEPERPSTSTD